ncbi:MAG: lysylphosphatidylglycerol synthase domain-containing protein, partial [Deltaproteobacteria bacterium]|nr:lysylphosphatidylglycerol synthase domain-containing protein [Deltaproteobacteria bacterium]
MLTLIFILGIIFFVVSHIAEFKELWSSPLPRHILVLMIPSYLLMLTINSELFRHPLKAYGLRLGTVESLALTASTTAINYVIPLKSGSGVKGIYLAGHHKITVTNYVALLVAISTLTLTVASFFATVGLIILVIGGSRPNIILLTYFSSTTLVGFLAIFFLGRLPFKLPGKLTAFVLGWDALRTTPR